MNTTTHSKRRAPGAGAVNEAKPAALDLEAIRGQFPALNQEVHGHRLVYLDNAATTLKPRGVIDAVCSVYEQDCANIHRGVHLLSQRATERYEGARETLRAYLNAASTEELIFTRGATESINLVAATLPSLVDLRAKTLVVTGLEHHSNLVPWQRLAKKEGAELHAVPLLDDGQIDIEDYQRVLNEASKGAGGGVALVAFAHVSNALGTVLPVKEMIEAAHRVGALALVDGAQALPHGRVDLQALDADFYVFSGHKLFAPTGVGLLYGKKALLTRMEPYQSGGDMIRSVSLRESSWNDLPWKFEAGTPNIAGVIGLGAAIEYLGTLDFPAIEAHEASLMKFATESLLKIPGLRIVGTAEEKRGAISFTLEGIHPHDIGTIVDAEGVALRTGHHCAQPVMERFGIPATTRASFAFYNTHDEVKALVAAIYKVQEMFGA